MSTRRGRIFSKVPDPVPGYELDPEHGYFSAVVPEATINIVANPSLEGSSLTGWSAYGAGVTRAATYNWQAYGACGLAVTPAASVESGVYYSTLSLTSGYTYTASVTIQGEAGKIYYMWFATSGASLLGSKVSWIATGAKQRIYVTMTEPSGSTSRRIYITRDSRYTDTHAFYLDGLQVENKAYPTTYCDGDQVGYVVGELAYYWTGTPHASTSGRMASTRSGGREYSLLDLGLRVDEIDGLGLGNIVDQSINIPGYGEFYQGTGTTSREFTITGNIYADSDDPRRLHQIRKTLQDVFKPEITVSDQPLLLRYQAIDYDGVPVSEMLDLKCTYIEGLEGIWNNNQQERLSIKFKMHTPFIRSTFSNGATLTANSSFACSRLAMRSPTGTWAAMGAGLDNYPRCMVVGRNGLLYIGGLFTSAGGVAVNYICSYDPTTGTYAALAGGCASLVTCMKIAPNGDLYVGTGATAGVAKVRKWDGAAWTDIGGNFNSDVMDIAFDYNGRIYAVGGFTQNGATNMDYFAYYDGAAWAEGGGGLTGAAAVTITIGLNNHAYVGGSFTDAGGVADTCGIVEFDGTSFISIGSCAGAAPPQVTGLATAPNGDIWATGYWTTSIGGVPSKHLAAWNGYSWRQISDGITYRSNVNKLFRDYLNNMYFIGDLLTTGIGVSVPDGFLKISGNLLYSMDINTDGVWISSMARLPNNSLVIGGAFQNAVSSALNAANVGGARAFPTFTFVGPGKLWQIWNTDTDSVIQFNGLTLLAGETASLSLQPDSISFKSNFRPSLMNYLIKGSSFDFSLLEGSNNISIYMSDTTGASLVTAYWNNLYWSIDGAVIE